MVSMALRARALATPTLRAGAKRSLHTSRVVCGEQAPSSAAQSAQYPQEGFNSSLWRFGLIALIGGAAAYRLTATKKDGSEEPAPLTKYIESLTTPTEETVKNNQAHLDWTLKKAESQLLMQDAQKPKAHRLKDLTIFEQYPRRNLPVGGEVDMSDLKLNPERV
ncbi:uncharacterized protein MJAP1_002541 [Malassezia japonica]|uniref:Uncharacterized protein n=1 Tax=Malassezia japonica TaxID=223818 RepID=A0AAF0F780_9BASI|nr:uncharacterized protein MJAP1_002541 [Malassezia japonica]WFD39562.1 hypothetical protein MJAP1_002541 [Malassezia japonica]